MGTQTSKPLFGDEERRNRFRRPRTPVNNTSTVPTAATASVGDKRTWPCSNCHATVSNEETRCPYCGGIQVKVRIPRSPLSATKAIDSNLLLERLGTPTTPVTRKQIDASKIQAFLSESATTSTMDYDEEEDDEEEGTNLPERPTSALSQASSLSQNFNIPIHHQQQLASLTPPFATSRGTSKSGSISDSPVPQDHHRPPDPVALTLESVRSAPSPQIVFEAPQKQQKLSEPAVMTKRKAASGFEVIVPNKKQVLPSSS